MSVIDESPGVTPVRHSWVHRAVMIAGLALALGAVPLAVLAAPSSDPVNLADCEIGWVWDPVGFNCVPYVDPVLGPVGPVGVGGVVGPVGVDPVLGPVGPVGVGRR